MDLVADAENSEPDATPDLFASARLYYPLPGRTHDLRPGFDRRLVALSEAVGLELAPPPPEPERRTWRNRSRHALGRHCQASPGRDEWFEPLMRAAVFDPDPDLNRLLVRPAVQIFGHRRVKAELLRVLRDGTKAERAGAARAWYAAGVQLRYPPGATSPTAESQALLDSVADLDEDWQHTALEVFVTDEDLDTRRCILALLDLRPEHCPPSLHDRVQQAIHIARTHDDEYLRHRVEIQIGD